MTFYRCSWVKARLGVDVVDSEGCAVCWSITSRKHQVALTRKECQKINAVRVENKKGVEHEKVV